MLLIAAGLKGYQLATEPTLGETLLESRWFLIALVEFELLFGIWLIAGLYPKPTRYIAILFFLMLACVSLSKAASGATACGCFGSVNVSPWLSAAFSLFSIAVLTRNGRTREPAEVNHKLCISVFLVICCAVISVGGIVMASPRFTTLTGQGDIRANEIVVLEPDQWIGQRCPLLQFSDDERLATGEWLVLLYKRDCETCVRLLSQAKQSTENVAILEIPQHGSVEAITLEQHHLMSSRLSDQYRWFLEGPAAIGLHDGEVVTVARSEESIQKLLVANSEPRTDSIVASDDVIARSTYDCGAASLYLICATDENRRSLDQLRSLTSTTLDGTNMLHLKQAAERLHFLVDAYRGTFSQLRMHVLGSRSYAILHIAPAHFVAVVEADKQGSVRILDPERGILDVDANRLNELYSWQGDMLLLASANSSQAERK